MELDLISSMHRAFYFHKREEAKEGFSWEQWQKSKIRAIEEYRKKNKLLVDSYSKPIQEAIDREVKGSFKSSIKNTVDKVKRMLGISVPDDISETQKVRDYIKVITGQKIEPPPEQSFFGVNDKKVNALQKVVENDLKKAQYSVLRKMDDVYRQTIYKSQVYMQSGAVTLNKAIDMATRDFLSKGINSIKYSDGKNVNIATYAEMCLRTANHRAKLLGEGSKRDEWGIHLVVVSAHANTCKLCSKWQGKILIDDVFSHPSSEYINQYKDKYELLSTAVKDGLMHVNCRHNIVTYFEGVTSVPVIQDEDEAVNMYRKEQKQRAFERAIRKQKRIAIGTLDPLEQGNAIEKLEYLKRQIVKHLNDNKQLRRNYEREELKGANISKNNGDNGLNNSNKYLNIEEKIIEHSNIGEFTNPKNPKKSAVGKFKSGGHGQENISLLEKYAIEYNIVKEYDNGVRIGNVPSHKMKSKQIGTGQSWFPKEWNYKDIKNSGKYVANIRTKTDFISENKYSLEGDLIAIFKYANYKGVTVGVCYDVKKSKVTTIFPDETQRMLGGNKND